MSGGDLIGKILSEHGVRYLFTLCGGHISPILAGCKKEGVRIIDVRNEATAVFAADAFSRLSGIPGVAAVTAGPGVTNCITALKNAQMAQSSLILLGGATATILKGRGSLQDIDQISIVKSAVKWSASAKKVKDIPELLCEAFFSAQEAVPGPVFLELPVDLLYEEKVVREWYGQKNENVTQIFNLRKKIEQWYISRHLNKIFSGTKKIRHHPIVKPRIVSHSENEIKKCCELLNSSGKPVMIIGSQIVLRPEKTNRLINAIEKLKIPVFLSGMARGLLGKNHPLQIKHKRKEALKNADVILLAGVPCDFRLDYGRHLSSKAKIISINLSKTDLFRNKKPNLAVHAEPENFLYSVSQKFLKNNFSGFVSELKKSDEKRESEINEMSKQKINGINPVFLFRKLENLIDDNSTLIADGGDFVGTASYILQPRKPLSWLDPGVFGTLGGGAGFALAAKLFNPSSEVWIIYGDGSFGYSLAEFDTFVRHKIPVIAVVGNDACWSQIERDQVEILKDDIGTKLLHSDYHIAAKGLGAEGILLNDENKIDEVFSEAKKIAKSGKPVVINTIIGKTDFRKGSISM